MWVGSLTENALLPLLARKGVVVGKYVDDDNRVAIEGFVRDGVVDWVLADSYCENDYTYNLANYIFMNVDLELVGSTIFFTSDPGDASVTTFVSYGTEDEAREAFTTFSGESDATMSSISLGACDPSLLSQMRDVIDDLGLPVVENFYYIPVSGIRNIKRHGSSITLLMDCEPENMVLFYGSTVDAKAAFKEITGSEAYRTL